MTQQATEFQQQCVYCQQTYYRNDECFSTDSIQDWHHPYIEYFVKGIWPKSLKDAHNLKRSLSKFLIDGGILFRTSFASESLHCISLTESQKVMVEIHVGECGEYQGWRKLYEQFLAHGYY
ncbi:hypothetical protein SLA2020_010100 [Shorea laevis]